VSHAHTLLVLSAAILLAGGGVITLALAWRRRYRGEPSGVVLSAAPTGRTIAAIAVVPIVGSLGVLGALVLIGILEGRLRPF
jgi:hypothetical protein